MKPVAMSNALCVLRINSCPLGALPWGVKYGLILLVFFHPFFIPYPHYLAPLVTAFQPLSGLRPSSTLPQVSPGAIHIISLRSLLRFNPYRG
jgi:hypothetical protein